MSQPASSKQRVTLRYDVAVVRDDWVLPEEPVPESQPHDLAVELLKAILAHWIARTARDAQVARNLAVRWDRAHPAVGVDPDVCLLEPRTPEGEELTSLCTWKEGHVPPRIAVEVVSESNPRKDYVSAPERYAASGTRELWIFDPKLAGPSSHGGPHRIQVWRREEDGDFVRTYAGEGPARSPELGAWLFAVNEGRRLRIADDARGESWWTTAEETERAAKDAAVAAKNAAVAAKDAAVAAKDALLARVAELEAELRRRGER